jgi:Bacteriocin-protection, YdeI or OmpD-Associated/Domain of unknown function (DUF1905)
MSAGTTVKFRARLELGGKTATGIEVPTKVVTGLGTSKRPAVRVTINGYTYRSTIAPRGGRFLLPVSAENRDGAGIAAGDIVEVELALDTEPRVLAVPPDLAKALTRDTAAKKVFDGLSYSKKQRFTIPIEQAKTSETRQRRVDKAVAELRNGET